MIPFCKSSHKYCFLSVVKFWTNRYSENEMATHCSLVGMMCYHWTGSHDLKIGMEPRHPNCNTMAVQKQGRTV